VIINFAEVKIMSHLEQLLELKQQIDEIQEQIKGIEQDAIAEAQEILASNPNSKTKIVFSNSSAKIGLVFKKKYPLISEVISLERLNNDIENETIKLAKENQEAIANIDVQISELKSQLEILSAKKEDLLFSPYLGQLKNKFLEELESNSYLQPSLNVYKNKQ
jgi:hypothetical protein